MSRLLVATTNRGKQAEFRRLLADLPAEIVTPDELGIDLDVPEPHDTYDITSASSGDEAAQLVNAAGGPCVDLLVTDLMMPGMNGRELALVTRRRFPNVRVLYVTGFVDTLFKDLTELGEGESFIEKPFGTDGLLEATRLLMFGQITDRQETADKRDDHAEWNDDRLRAKIIRVLRKLRMA